MRTTIFNCFGSVVDWRDWRLPPDLAPVVRGEVPLGISGDSFAPTRYGRICWVLSLIILWCAYTANCIPNTIHQQ